MAELPKCKRCHLRPKETKGLLCTECRKARDREYYLRSKEAPSLCNNRAETEVKIKLLEAEIAYMDREGLDTYNWLDRETRVKAIATMRGTEAA